MCWVKSSYMILQAILLLLFLQVAGSMWWSLSQLPVHQLSLYGRPEALCGSTPGLIGTQKRLCRDKPDVMLSVADGAKIAVRECQKQFRKARWNCSSDNRDTTVFGKVTHQGTRETAFLHAIHSAGVVYSLTRACSKGDLPSCACDESKMEGVGGPQLDKFGGQFSWGGCSDNIRHSNRQARKFIDAAERIGRDTRALMNLHNNAAGRRSVRKKMLLQCKCHGVSGSCAARTCWRALSDFRTVGDQLRKRYEGAIQVTMSQQGSGLILSNKAHKSPTRSDLVYLEDSPDYCLPDHNTGSLGTVGRQCQKTPGLLDSCDIMCCGRGYNTIRIERVRKCECKFHWCCAVKCNNCRTEIDIHTCKPLHRYSSNYLASSSSSSSSSSSLSSKDKPVTNYLSARNKNSWKGEAPGPERSASASNHVRN